MLIKTLYNRLNKPQASKDVLKTAERFIKEKPQYGWVPFGNNPANKSSITITSDSGRALVERIINVFDSYSAKYVEEHPEAENASSVRELVQGYMKNNLGKMIGKERASWAKEIGYFTHHKIYNGKVAVSGQKTPPIKHREECISITDTAQGMDAEEMVTTGILSLHSSNKIGKPWLQGQYGQGGAASLSHCSSTFIASRKQGSDDINFSVIKKQPAGGQWKQSLWLMLVHLKTGLPIIINKDEVKMEAIECGTKITHFNYASEEVSNSGGSQGTVFHLFRRLLPNCEFPMYFDDRTPARKNSENSVVLYGSCKVIEVKKTSSTLGERKKLLFTSDIEEVAIDDGFVDVQVHVLANKLERAFEKQTPIDKANKVKKTLKSEKEVSPITDYFEKGKSAFITVNGQNQHEFDLRNTMFAPFPLLKNNLIVEVSIDRLTIDQKDNLEVSTRESMKTGSLLDRIVSNVAVLMKLMPELISYEDEFERKASTNKVKDQSGLQMVIDLGLFGQIKDGKVGTLVGRVKSGKAGRTGLPRVKKTSTRVNINDPQKWLLLDDPTFIEFKHDGLLPIYLDDKSGYAWISTDAKDYYDDSIKITVSGMNPIYVSRTALKNGGCRINLDASNSKIDDTGIIKVTLKARDGTIHTDKTTYVINEPVAQKNKANKKGSGTSSLATIPEPEVEFVPVTDDNNNAATYIIGNSRGNLTTLAGFAIYSSTAGSGGGKITIWYSKVYGYYIGCLKAAGGKKNEEKFIKIVRKYLSASAITNIMDRYDTNIPITDVTVDWNTAMKSACFIAAENLKK